MADSTFTSPFTPMAVALYAGSALDVHTDTTVTVDYSWANFKHIVFLFLQTTSTSSFRSIIDVPSQVLAQGGYYAIAQGTTISNVRIGGSSTEPYKIRIISTSLSSLYLYRIWGIN